MEDKIDLTGDKELVFQLLFYVSIRQKQQVKKKFKVLFLYKRFFLNNEEHKKEIKDMEGERFCRSR